jgi:hypothetical protein
MKDLKIPPTAQIAGLAALGAAVLTGIWANLPEVQRYLKVRRM